MNQLYDILENTKLLGAACQAPLSFTISQSVFKLMSEEVVWSST